MWYNEPTVLIFVLSLVALILIIYASAKHSRREAAELEKTAKQIATDKYHADMTMVDAGKDLRFKSEPAPRVVVNIPPDFKPIQPLPGDTSLDGQKALLWYSVFKEALDQQEHGHYIEEDEVQLAIDAANTAVATCYASNPTGPSNT